MAWAAYSLPVFHAHATPSANAKTAAADLQTYVENMTGVKLPLATDSAAPAGTLILVGRSGLTDKITDLKIPSGRVWATA